MTGSWELGDEVGPVRTDEEYVPYSDGEFAEECAEEACVQAFHCRLGLPGMGVSPRLSRIREGLVYARGLLRSTPVAIQGGSSQQG